MKILGFDIETFKEHFCFVGHMFDSETRTKIRDVLVTDDGSDITKSEFEKIEKAFDEADYIVSFNGKRFDLPILANVAYELSRRERFPVKYVYTDAQELIGYDINGNSFARRRSFATPWSHKHFDLLNNCLLRYSLKQWEMYQGLRIRELPFAPDAELSDDDKRTIDEYCAYDVFAMMSIFWRYGFDKPLPGRPSLLATREIMKWWPEGIPVAFDRTAQQLGAGIIYKTLGPVPPRSIQPLSLFDIESFEVPDELKDTIRNIAKNSDKDCDATFMGIAYGKGGAHYIKEGYHEDVHVFDFASLYPSIIERWGLMKTNGANEEYHKIKTKRIEIKHSKKNDPMLQNLDIGLKQLLNAPTGAFRVRNSYSTIYDPAAGEAMCYIGQLIISELAFACPEFGNLIEVNTDSVFVVGEANVTKCREMVNWFAEKYGTMILEEEVIPKIYIRDVNNYIMYDELGNVTGGKGLAYSDKKTKASNIAVYDSLFQSLILDHKKTDWTNRPWTDFIVKYHKSAASKYAMIDGKPMEHKNYYFLWTTRDCPAATTIAFGNTLIERKTGAIKARYGVATQDMSELEQWFRYVDLEQYQRDLDAELVKWERSDLTTTHYDKSQLKGVKTMKDIIERGFV